MKALSQITRQSVHTVYKCIFLFKKSCSEVFEQLYYVQCTLYIQYKRIKNKSPRSAMLNFCLWKGIGAVKQLAENSVTYTVRVHLMEPTIHAFK